MDPPLELCCEACGYCYTIHPAPPQREICRQLRRSPRTSCKPTITSKAVQSTNNVLCTDCLEAIKMLAIPDDNNDVEKDSTPGSLANNEIDNFIEQQHDSVPELGVFDHNETDYSYHLENSNCSHQLAFSTFNEDLFSSRIVSPESSKSVRLISSKLCRTCNIREVPEQFMEYCKRCYALNCKGIKFISCSEKHDTRETASSLTTGRCRLCKGFVRNSSHQYCVKCYSAKQKDEAKRIEKELYRKQFKKQPQPPAVDHIPYICVDCGNTIHDCSWKTKCPPCYALTRAAVQGKPKLIKTPAKRRFQVKRKRTR
jgi:hypothetical protein